MIGLFEESTKRWVICANLFLKMALTQSHAIIDDSDRNMKLILDTERAAVQHLQAILSNWEPSSELVL
ncbi:hypothetical protein GK047_12035 [Paenibacillus sp. SYP-B3998]|uniref:Uncharacterized protein n=1 Tax=Paenibacillus sp. SYP-B3998 TaxID=2678564 RepID=A0A6G3ZYH6_9BACL|nr:hypothetical protein [Paenibacillus sp. SYP-B3998]NEW06744.1 hypothetical protein [Paenibacillus sp. SYP-B3998]